MMNLPEETLDSLGLREIYIEKLQPFKDAFERLYPFAVYENEQDLLAAGLRAKADEIAARVRAESGVYSTSVAEIGVAPHVYMPFWRAGLHTVDDVLQWVRDGCPKIRNAGRKRTEIMMDAVQGLASVEAVECTG